MSEVSTMERVIRSDVSMEECKKIYGEDFLKIQEIVKRKCNRR